MVEEAHDASALAWALADANGTWSHPLATDDLLTLVDRLARTPFPDEPATTTIGLGGVNYKVASTIDMHAVCVERTLDFWEDRHLAEPEWQRVGPRYDELLAAGDAKWGESRLYTFRGERSERIDYFLSAVGAASARLWSVGEVVIGLALGQPEPEIEISLFLFVWHADAGDNTRFAAWGEELLDILVEMTRTPFPQEACHPTITLRDGRQRQYTSWPEKHAVMAKRIGPFWRYPRIVPEAVAQVREAYKEMRDLAQARWGPGREQIVQQRRPQLLDHFLSYKFGSASAWLWHIEDAVIGFTVGQVNPELPVQFVAFVCRPDYVPTPTPPAAPSSGWRVMGFGPPPGSTASER